MVDGFGEVERERGAEAFRLQRISFVNEKFERSADAIHQDHERFRQYYDLYRGTYQRRFHPFRNNITIPLLFSMVQSDAARKASTLLGGTPYIAVVGGGPEDAAKAHKQEALLQVQLEDAETFEKSVDFLIGSDLYGTQVYRWWWEERTGTAEIRVDIGGGEELIQTPVTKFSGPQWGVVDLLDFFPPPGFSRIRDMPGVIHRYWLDIEEVIVRGEAGFFDKAQVQALRDGAGPSPAIIQDLAMRRVMGLASPKKEMDKFSKPVEILEFWGKVPRNLSTDGKLSRCWAVANRKFLMRDVANPYPGEVIPFGAHTPMPDPHYFYGPGMVEINAKLQVASNRIANQKMDALDLTIDPMFLYNRRSGFDPRQLRMRPLGAIGVDGPPTEEMIRVLSPDLRGLQGAYLELEQQSKWMQQGAGITEDTVQGFSAGDRVTASEFRGRQEAVSNRILLGCRLAEKQWLEPLARRFLELDRKFLSMPQTIRMIGAAGLIDPITLQPIPPEDLTLGVNDLIPDYDYTAIGATRQMGIMARQQSMGMLQQQVQSNPVGLAITDWVAFFRQLYKAHEIPNMDQLLRSEAVQWQALMQAQMVLAGGGGPSGSGQPKSGPEGGEETGIDPQMIATMIGGLGGGQAGGGGASVGG